MALKVNGYEFGIWYFLLINHSHKNTNLSKSNTNLVHGQETISCSSTFSHRSVILEQKIFLVSLDIYIFFNGNRCS